MRDTISEQAEHARRAEAADIDYGVPGGAVSALLFVFIVVASLYLARAILMPFALAILLSFMLSPLVRRLQRWRVPRSARCHFGRAGRLCGIFALGGRDGFAG